MEGFMTTEFWSNKSAVQLRKRLGWSVSEMARRLNLTTEEVRKIESGEKAIKSEQKNALSYIEAQLEKHVETLHHDPIAESFLKEKKLSQVHKSEVKLD